MNSKLFRLNPKDLGKGLIVAVLAALFAYLASLMEVPGFSLDTLDWAVLLKVAITAALGYLGKNFVSDSEGKVLGKI